MKGSVDIREDLNLYPATATQELIFKRVSSYSLSYEDIVKSKAAEKTVGIFTTDKSSNHGYNFLFSWSKSIR